MQTKIKKRILLVDEFDNNLYVINSLKSKFDQVIEINDYIKPLEEIKEVIGTYGRMPALTYSDQVSPTSPDKLIVKTINKVKYVKTKSLDLGEDNAYFVVGKLSWYYLRDFLGIHVGLRNTNLDWQIVHLGPYSLGSNKFVFCHTMTDEHYSKHMEYFFDDSTMLKTVKPLKSSKILYDIKAITKALKWAEACDKGTRFGMDYETNGFYRDNKYEDLMAIGVGISTSEVGFYCELRGLSDEDLETFKSVYQDFLDKHETNIWVFNINFEMMVTRKLLGPWATYEFKDADIWRVMYGDQVGYSKKRVEQAYRRKGNPENSLEKVGRDQRWSLKYTAQKYLNVPSWDDEFEDLESMLGIIFNGYGLKEVDDFLTNPILSPEIKKIVKSGTPVVTVTRIIKKLANPKKVNTVQDLKDIFKDVEFNEDAFRIALLGTRDLNEVTSHSLWAKILNKYPEEESNFIKLLDDPRFMGNQYAVQPGTIVGNYCVLDAYYTVMIAETQLKIDRFTPEENNPNVNADWASTDNLINIFNSNKSLGATLDMYGLYKSNTKRDRFNKVQEAVRVYCNYILAKGYFQLLLSNVDIKPHENEKYLSKIFIEALKRKLDPTDSRSITKNLFKSIYDSSQPYRWSDKVAKSLVGEELAELLKEKLLDYNSKGFGKPSAFSGSPNLHKSCEEVLEEAWNDQDLPKDFDWKLCKEYYVKIGNVSESKDLLTRLNTFNINGMKLEEVLELDNVVYVDEIGDTIVVPMSEAVTLLKKRFFDVATANEVKLGHLFEDWKEMRVLLTMYSKEEHFKMIDDLNLFSKEDSIQTKVDNFFSYIRKIIQEYIKPVFHTWEAACMHAKKNHYSEELCNPNQEDMDDSLQQKAYMDKVVSQDLYNQFKVSKKLMDDFVWFMSISKDMMKDEKEWLLKYKKASPLAYRDRMLEKGTLCDHFDLLKFGEVGHKETSELLRTCDISDKVDYSYYPLLATCFKLYRKYDKLGQYLNGQLVDSDHHLLGVEEDGVPILGPMTKSERKEAVYGDTVKMFPRYEIMQKSTKRNSAGIHTVPNLSEVKGIIVAPEDQLLVYTDISSMELRGIAAIADDKVMIDYFESGKDIYTEAAMAYHVDFLGKDMTYKEVRKKYRNPYKIGVISTIYTATDPTLAKSFGVETFEVKYIKDAIFKKFQRLYDWQQEQILWNKKNNGFIKSFFGDIRKTYDKPKKQARQSINYDVQGSCSLVATSGFNNIITSARKAKMYLAPAVIVHDAIVAYSMAKDLEVLYDHYQKNFYDYLDENYGFRFPFDLEIAVNYFEKTVMEKGDNPREFTIEGTNRAVRDVLSRAIKYGKRVEFADPKVSIESISESIDDGYGVLDQYLKSGGMASFNRDFSYGKYKFKFVD
jgi:hypothetical protein